MNQNYNEMQNLIPTKYFLFDLVNSLMMQIKKT